MNDKVKVCYHKDFGDEDKDLAIFSHAGMTKTFFDNKDLIETYTNLMRDVVLDPNSNPNIVTRSQEPVNELREKYGGVYKTTNNVINKSIIMERIDLFNNKTKELIKDVLNNQKTMILFLKIY